MPVAADKAAGQTITAAHINAIAALLNLLESQGVNGSGLPFYVRPASTSTDIGPLVNAALQNYGVALVAANPNPGEFWSCTTPIKIGTNEALVGFGMGTSRIRCSSSFPTGQDLVSNRDGDTAGVRISGVMLHGNNRARNAIRMNTTAAPNSAALTNPDHVNVIEDVHARSATGDGIYVGGSNAYSGNGRESRVRGCLVVGNGGWGLTIASSDMFVFDVTAHGNGPGGIRSMSGQAGNLKLIHCKAYYESIGFQLDAIRSTVTGGEVQDCANGITLASDSTIAGTTIDTCGSSSIAALKVAGARCTFSVHMTGRDQAGSPGNGKNYAVELSANGQEHAGHIATHGHYGALWRTANRPSSGSTLVVS